MKTLKDREIKLTDRDIEIFKKLLECEAMTSQHIFALFFLPSAKSRCIYRITSYAYMQWVVRLPQKTFYYEGRKHDVIVPCKKTAQMVAGWEHITIEETGWNGRELEKDNIFIPHFLDITSVNVEFTKAAARYGFTFEWINALSMKQRGMIDRIEVEKSGSVQTVSVEPDAYMLLSKNEAHHPFSSKLTGERKTERLYPVKCMLTVITRQRLREM